MLLEALELMQYELQDLSLYPKIHKAKKFFNNNNVTQCGKIHVFSSAVNSSTLT